MRTYPWDKIIVIVREKIFACTESVFQRLLLFLLRRDVSSLKWPRRQAWFLNFDPRNAASALLAKLLEQKKDDYKRHHGNLRIRLSGESSC